MTTKQHFKRQFDNKKIHTAELLSRIMVHDDTGYIVLQASSVTDVISSYSVRGYEYLNSEFKGLLDKFIEFLPDTFPVILEITGCDFTEAEQEQVQNAIWHEYEYDYLAENRDMKKTILRAASSLLFSLIFLSYLYFWNPTGLVVDLIWIPLWTFLDSVICLFLYDLPGSRKNKRRFIQKQTMKLLFSKTYEDDDPPEQKIQEYHSAILENTSDEEI